MRPKVPNAVAPEFGENQAGGSNEMAVKSRTSVVRVACALVAGIVIASAVWAGFANLPALIVGLLCGVLIGLVPLGVFLFATHGNPPPVVPPDP